MTVLRVVVAAGLIWAGCARPEPIDLGALLREADRLAWLTNWTAATPLFVRAETVARDSGDTRNALYAKFGRLRGEMQIRPLPDVSAELARDLEAPLAKSDSWLRLRGLTAKGDIDLEWDVPAAHATWQEVLQLATELRHEGWVNRARGELGMLAFLQGDSGRASAMVGESLQTAARLGDVGGQVRYLSAIGAGLLLAGDPRSSLGYIEKALSLAQQHPETGFPYPAQSTKILALLALKQPDDAQRLVDAALKQAAGDEGHIKEVELLMMAATIARTKGQDEQALSHIERAVEIATDGGVQRLLGDAEAERAGVYRQRGDMDRAMQSAEAAVRATKAAGSRWELPQQLQVLASMQVARGQTAEAEQTYEEAQDVLEGTMLNVPSSSAQARLVGVMSEVYTGHFTLAAKQRDPKKAFAVLERARGRALADILRGTRQGAPSDDQRYNRTISHLQVRLLRARTSTERRAILDELRSAEQSLRPLTADAPLVPRARPELAAIQERLAPTETLFAYVLSEPNSFCLIVSRTDARIVTLTSGDTINAAAESFIDDVRAGRSSSERQKLYDLVFAPVMGETRTDRIIVVPDGQLHRVPFDLLLDGGTQSAPSVTTAPSATVFALLRQSTAANPTLPPRALLAIGGVPYNSLTGASTTRSAPASRGLFDAERPPKLGAIPASRAEVLSIARLLDGDKLVLTGRDANESNVKSQKLTEYGILHFAVHAFADPDFPARAALVLLGDPLAGDDGLIQPREISSWNLNASLVVLSACDTSVGPTIGQEGVQNLARAFLEAGARSVITTLWTVDDRVSLALMRALYRRLAEGEPVATALTLAKREVAQQLGPPALPTIAAFQVVGDGDAKIVIPQEQLTRTSLPAGNALRE